MNKEQLEQAVELLWEEWRDPVFFCTHALGVWVWSKMEEVLRSVAENEKTIVAACHGSSKTFTGALAIIWFMNVFTAFSEPGVETKAITTAPTFKQVEMLLWSAIRKVYRTSRIALMGDILTTKIKMEEAENYAIGFSTDSPERSEGWHAWNLLFVLDEGKGIEQWMWDTAMAQMGAGNSRLLVLSTTDGIQPGSEFYRAAKIDTEDWNIINIDCFELPAFTGEKLRRYKWNDPHGFDFQIEKKSADNLHIQLSDKKWEQKCKKKWGEKSLLYLTKCRGMIVDDLPDQCIPLWKVMKMFQNYEDPDFDDAGQYQLGGDIARFGTDSTAVWLRKGMKIARGPLELNKLRGFEIVDRWELEGFILGKDMKMKIDDTGLGATVTDELVKRHYSEVYHVNFKQKAKDTDLYPKAIDEMWFEMEEKIEFIACPYNEELLTQLIGRKKLKHDDAGRRRIESKIDYQERTKGKSPDLADSFLLAFYEPLGKGGYVSVSDKDFY